MFSVETLAPDVVVTTDPFLFDMTEFTATTQADNRSIMGVFIASGFRVSSSMQDEFITATLPIRDDDESTITRARQRHIAYGADEATL